VDFSGLAKTFFTALASFFVGLPIALHRRYSPGKKIVPQTKNTAEEIFLGELAKRCPAVLRQVMVFHLFGTN
jgi:hypothetical protein